MCALCDHTGQLPEKPAVGLRIKGWFGSILQAKFKLYYRNYFYIIFRICHRAIFCTLILSRGCPLGGLNLGWVGLRCGLWRMKHFLLFVHIWSESGTVWMSLPFSVESLIHFLFLDFGTAPLLLNEYFLFTKLPWTFFLPITTQWLQWCSEKLGCITLQTLCFPKWFDVLILEAYRQEFSDSR